MYNMKKFTHIAIVAAAALAVTGCSVHTDDPTPVEEVYAAEILTPTAESSLTTSEVTALKTAAASVFADKIIEGNDYIWLSIDADDYGIDLTKLVNTTPEGYCYDSATNLRLCYLGDNLSLLCEVIRYDIEEVAGYIDNTITPVAYHFYQDTDELYTLKSTYYMQERFETYRKADAQGNYPTEFFDEPLTDFITGESYKHLRLDRYFMKNGHEFHIMLYSQVFEEYVEEDGTVLYAMTDPNGIVIIRRVDENGNDVMDELLYSPSNELSYTMERTFLDLNFDYTGFNNYTGTITE